MGFKDQMILVKHWEQYLPQDKCSTFRSKLRRLWLRFCCCLSLLCLLLPLSSAHLSLTHSPVMKSRIIPEARALPHSPPEQASSSLFLGGGKGGPTGCRVSPRVTRPGIWLQVQPADVYAMGPPLLHGLQRSLLWFPWFSPPACTQLLTALISSF